MSIPQSGGGPIESLDQLAGLLESGCKPRDQWRIGTEHEKFGWLTDSRLPLPYAGDRSISALFAGLESRFGWTPVREGGNVIGLTRNGANISLEPGGQFELSGAPLVSALETAAELDNHLDEVRQIADPLGIRFLSVGAAPEWRHDQMPVMPKGRYRLMTDYMGRVGTHGTQMMYRTSTVQVNLDFSSEADMVKKMRVSLALQPVATALFANSPFLEGKANGYLSYRSHIWCDTDNARAGMLPFVFDEGFGFEAYVDYALKVPMYFVKRGDTYHDVTGQSFGALLEGKLPGMPGERAAISDWANHLTTIFPEVRLKRFIEMRGADVGDAQMIPALSAFWVGLLYDDVSLDAAWDLVKGWDAQMRQQLRDDVPKAGLKAQVGGHSLLEIARSALALSAAGLKRRARKDAQGRDETRFLAPLSHILSQRHSRAEVLLAQFKSEWHGDVSPAFRTCVF